MNIKDYMDKLEQYISYCNKKMHEYEAIGAWDEKESWFARGHAANNKLNRAFANLY